jgi:hypothetical protein
VLVGYRDLEADPDLEAYFCDRDVLNYIESYDHISRKLSPKVRIGMVSEINRDGNGGGVSKEKLGKDYLGEVKERLEKVKGKLMGQGEIQRRRAVTAIAITTGIIAMLLAYIGIMHRAELEKPSQTKGKGEIRKKIGVRNNTKVDKNKDRSQDARERVGLSTKELDDILSTWLTVKKLALEGRPIPKSARKVASLGAVRRLESERISNERKGEQQKTKVAVKEIVILSSKASQIEIEATLDYEDIKYNKSGELIARTPRHIFKRKYVLIKEKDRWLVE